MSWIWHATHRAVFVQLLEPTPGMHCPLASGFGTNIFLAFAVSSGSCTVRILQPNGWPRSYHVILWPWFWLQYDLSEHGGKHHLLQTSSQPMSEQFQYSVNVLYHVVSLTWKNKRLLYMAAVWSKWTWRKALSASDIISTYVRTISIFSKCVIPCGVADLEK